MSNLLDKASIVLTPTAYDNGKVLCVKPSDGSGDFDFSRNSAATRVNAQGLVENVQTISGNLLDYSTFTSSSASWSLVGGLWVYDDTANGFILTSSIDVVVGDVFDVVIDLTIASGNANLRYSSSNAQTTLFPFTDFVDGVNEFQATVTGVDGFLQRLFAPASLTDNPFTLNSISIKKISQDTNLPRINYDGFSFDGSGNIIPDSGCGSWLFEPQSTNLYLNSETLSTQTITTTANQYSVSFYGTGTITFSGTHTGSLTGTGLNDRVTATFSANAGTLTSTVSGTVTKAQIEQLNFATSYIPTTTTTVTRNQDVCTGGGSAASINSTEGVLYFEGSALANDGTSRRISLNDGTSSNKVNLEYDETSNRIRASITSGGSAQTLTYNAPNLLQFNKIAVKYKLNDFAIWFNGVEVVTDTSGNAPISLTELSFNNSGTSLPFFGKTKAVAVWKEALTDAELTSLTTI